VELITLTDQQYRFSFWTVDTGSIWQETMYNKVFRGIPQFLQDNDGTLP